METHIKKWLFAFCLCILGIMYTEIIILQIILGILIIYYTGRLVKDIIKLGNSGKPLGISDSLKKDLSLNYGSLGVFMICLYMYVTYRQDLTVILFMVFSMFMYVTSFIHCIRVNHEELRELDKRLMERVSCHLKAYSETWEKD